MKRQQYIIVEHRQPEMVKALRQEIFDLKAEIRTLKTEYRRLEVKYGGMVYLNCELVDLSRDYGVPRQILLRFEKRVNRYMDAL